MKKTIICLLIALALPLSIAYAESEVPIDISSSTFQANGSETMTIHNISVLGGYFWAQFQWNRNTYKWDLITVGQEQSVSVAGWWDIFIPSVGSDKKIDAMYLKQNNLSILGKNILSKAITGTINGTSIQLFFAHKGGYSFIGTLSGDIISGNLDQTTPAYFKKSTFHITNFTPGEELPGLTPSFEWTPTSGADRYLIRVSHDNSGGNCDDTNSCIGIWELDNIKQTEITYNSDGKAIQALIPGDIYRARIIAYSNGSIVDTTMDVHFRVSG